MKQVSNKMKLFSIVEASVDLSTLKVELTENSDFLKDLGIDSLDMLELFMRIEEEFEIKIPDSRYTELTTIHAIFQYIDEYEKK